MPRRLFAVPMAILAAALVALCAPSAFTQPPDKEKKGGPGGKGGFGFGGEERKIVKDFDKNKDGWLNAEERKPRAKRPRRAARAASGSKGGKGGGEGGKPGPKVKPDEVKNFPDAKLYDATVLRTIFLEFENSDWELEMQDFHGTDVEVPATATVDGKKYANVGVHFRGMSSYGGVPAGSKRSLNLSFDIADEKQRLLRLQDAQPAQRARRPVVPEHGAVLAHRRPVHPRAEGELREGGHQRRELGRVRQRPAVRQGVPG